MFFFNADTGYIVGNDYLFKKTMDGGQTWTDIPVPSLGERPGNNGNIIGIDYHLSPNFGQVESGLILTWEKPLFNIVTSVNGTNFQQFHNFDSAAFCFATDISVHAMANGYVQIITLGETCDSSAILSLYSDGPFSTYSVDSGYSVKPGRFTTLDSDSASSLLGHSDGNVFLHTNFLGTIDTVFIDSSGVNAVAFAGNDLWYAASGTNYYNIFISTDGGQTFQVDSTFFPSFFYPVINDMDFLPNGIGLAGALSNMYYGSIIVKGSSGWNWYIAEHPINSVKILDDGTGYAGGDSGLVMKTTGLLTLGKNEIIKETIKVYPNPAHNKVYISGISGEDIRTVTLTDLQGKKVRTFNSSNNGFDISGLPTSMYLLEVVTDSGRIVEKLLIQ